MSKYNGWTNWETWAAVLWATNDETSYRKWVRAANAHQGDMAALANYLQQVLPDWTNGDLETAEEWDAVNWEEVAKACLEEVGQ